MPKSLPYHDFLMARLKNPSYAAVYLETHFELDEGEEPDEALLKRALGDVAEALGQPKMTPEEYELHLKNWMNCCRSKEVMRFIIWELG